LLPPVQARQYADKGSEEDPDEAIKKVKGSGGNLKTEKDMAEHLDLSLLSYISYFEKGEWVSIKLWSFHPRHR